MCCPGTESQVILIAVTKRAEESRGRGPSLDETNCSQRESRVTDIQRDELKQCQGREGQEQENSREMKNRLLNIFCYLLNTVHIYNLI